MSLRIGDSEFYCWLVGHQLRIGMQFRGRWQREIEVGFWMRIQNLDVFAQMNHYAEQLTRERVG